MFWAVITIAVAGAIFQYSEHNFLLVEMTWINIQYSLQWISITMTSTSSHCAALPSKRRPRCELKKKNWTGAKKTRKNNKNNIKTCKLIENIWRIKHFSIYALSVSTTFFSIREWRSAIRVKIARMFILCRYFSITHHYFFTYSSRKSTFEAPEAPQPPPSLKGKRAEAESDIYFGDLAVAWDKCLRSKEAKSGRL